MKRILCTGAAGFISSWVCRDLLKRGHFVIGVDDLSGGFHENVAPLLAQYPHQFLFYKQDVGNYAAMKETMLAHRPEIGVHCASNAREGASFFSPHDITYRNAMIGATLLELGILHKMQRFVFFSSMSVYGEGRVPFDEKAKRAPVDVYGVNKLSMEMMIEQLAPVHGFTYVILRPHNVIGIGQSMVDPFRNVAAIFCNRVLLGEPLYIFGENHKRAFSAIEDSLPCFIRAILNETLTETIINVGGKEAVTIDELAQVVIEQFPEKKVEIIHTPPRYGEVPLAFATFARSEELLGYEERVGWRESIKRMAAWARQQAPNGKPWRFSPLPLMTEAAPLPWKKLNNFTNKS